MLLLRRVLYAPFGTALRAARDSPLRAEAIGLPVQRLRLAAFALAGAAAGLAGGLYAYAKGSVFPTYISIPKSVDALLMVLLGGVETISGPIVGALAYVGLYDTLLRATDLVAPGAGRRDRCAGAAVPRRHRRRGAAAVAARMTVLAVEGLSKSFGGVAAVRSVGFAVAAGEMLALIGPNGAGKSTCFNMLGGQLRPDAGRVLLDGQPITGLGPRAIWRRGVGRTFQITATFASMTVRENVQTALLAAAGRVARPWRPARHLFMAEADALLDQVGLRHRGRPRRRRAGLWRPETPRTGPCLVQRTRACC